MKNILLGRSGVMVDVKVWYVKYDVFVKYYGLFNKKIGIWKI